jgi:glutathione S-transferase
MKLYHSPQSRSVRARWMLEELGVPYDLVTLDISAGGTKTPEHMARHPHGAVPVLTDGNMNIFESAAICLYLADKYPDKKMAPPVGSPDRGPYYQWVVYTMATLEPPLVDIFFHSVQLPEAQRDPKRVAEARERFKEVAKALTKALEGKQWLVGDHFTAADLMVGSTLGWGAFMGLLEGQPALQAYVQRCNERPAAQKSQA